MRRFVLGMSTGMIAALLCFAPATADEDSPQMRTRADGSQIYTDPSLADESTIQVTGVLRKVIADTTTGSTESTIIITEDGSVIPVEFDAEIAATDVPVTAQLVDGSQLDAALDGESDEPVEVAAAKVASVTAAAVVGINHRAYVAIVTDSGQLDPTATINSRVESGLAYWEDEGDVSLPSFSRSSTVAYNSSLTGSARCGVSNPERLWDEVDEEDLFPGVNFSAPGNHLIVVVSYEGCEQYGVGIGTVGSSINSGGQTVMTDDASIFTSTVVHELGHNFGLDHANFCAPGCSTPVAYWNLYSVMGLAVSGSTFGPSALDSAFRDQLGITETGETAQVAAGQSLTATLTPRGTSASGSLQGIEVLSGGTSYWVEYRNGGGRDLESFYGVANGSSISGRSYPDGVTITRQATNSDDPLVLMARTSSAGSWSAGTEFAAGSARVTINSVDGSAASVTVGSLPALVTTAPTISGTAKVGTKLTASATGWTPGTTFTYRWTYGTTTTAASTSPTLNVPAAAFGKSITATVTGTSPGFAPATRTSAATAKTIAGTLTAPTPKISGTVKVGSILTAKPGTYSVPVKLTYRWYISGKAVSKSSTSARFKIPKSLKGKKILVKVTASKVSYTSVTKSSAFTKKVS